MSLPTADRQLPIALLSIAYLPPLHYFSKLINCKETYIELHEHFIKQTYRTRCHIYGANGLLRLSVPIQHQGERTIIKDIKISHNTEWQKLHWRSLESAYRSSPFFEYYEDTLAPFYLEKKFEYLVDLNNELLSIVNSLLKISPVLNFTSDYQKEHPDKTDYRDIISAKTNDQSDFIAPSYMQVFENKKGFIPNLSIVDLLFNQGPSSIDYLALK